MESAVVHLLMDRPMDPYVPLDTARVQRDDEDLGEDHSEDDDDANGSDLIEIYRYEINIHVLKPWCC